MPCWATCLGQEEVCGGGRRGLQNKSRRCAQNFRWELMAQSVDVIYPQGVRGSHRMVVDVMSYEQRRGGSNNERRLQGRTAYWHQPLLWQQAGCQRYELQEAEGGESNNLYIPLVDKGKKARRRRSNANSRHGLTFSSQGGGKKKNFLL
jgi:hypothetical protein